MTFDPEADDGPSARQEVALIFGAVLLSQILFWLIYIVGFEG